MTSQTQDLVITNTSSIPPSNTISFGYVKKEDVKVELGTTEQNRQLKSYPSEWTITSDNKVQLISSLFSATGTYKLRISRQTDTSTPAHTFVVGSSIKAEDLNNTNKQALFAVEENTDSINSLAMGDASGAIQIDGSNIADNSINSDKIINLQVKDVDLSSHISDDSLRAVTTNHIRDNAVTTAKIPDDNVTANKLKSSSSTDSDRAVTTNHIRDGAVTDAKLSNISGTSINPNFGSQNISTTGTLNAGTTTTGTTTTGSTTAQDLTVTNNLTLSSGNQDNKGLIFPTDIGGGTGDKAYIRYFVDGTGENTRLKIGNENDGDDDIYLQAGLVQTSGPLTVNGLLTANSFSGLPVQDVKVAWNTTATNFGNNSSWHTHLEVGPFTNVTSSSKFLIVSVYDIKNESSSTNCATEARITEVNGSLTSNTTNSRTADSYLKYNHIEFDRASNSSNRTYRLQCRATNSHTSCNAFMDDAFLAVFHLKPS